MTPEQKVFIIENRLQMTNQQIAEKLNVRRQSVGEYLIKHEIKPPSEIINKRRSEAVSEAKLRKRGVVINDKFYKAYDYAKSRGYGNVTEALRDLGKPAFMEQFKQSDFNS